MPSGVYKRAWKPCSMNGCSEECLCWNGCKRKYFCKGNCKTCNVDKIDFSKIHDTGIKNITNRQLCYKLNKEHIKALVHNRRVLTKDLTKEIIQRVYKANIKKYGTLTCILCFKPIKFGEDSLEHLTPVSRGGSNKYKNLGVSHLSCNCQKGTMTLKEWFEKQEKVMPR